MFGERSREKKEEGKTGKGGKLEKWEIKEKKRGERNQNRAQTRDKQKNIDEGYFLIVKTK